MEDFPNPKQLFFESEKKMKEKTNCWEELD